MTEKTVDHSSDLHLQHENAPNIEDFHTEQPHPKNTLAIQQSKENKTEQVLEDIKILDVDILSDKNVSLDFVKNEEAPKMATQTT